MIGAVVVLAVLGLCAVLWPAPTHGRQQGAGLPAHDYVFIDAAAARDPMRLVARLQQQLQRSFVAAGLSQPGYPRPCYSALSKPDSSGVSQVSCREGARKPSVADGLLLDAEGHFLQFMVVDYPSQREYLMEIFIVSSLTRPKLLSSDARWTLPRVVLLPYAFTSDDAALQRALRLGVEAAGARALTL